MAELGTVGRIAEEQDGHEIAEARFERRMRIDVELDQVDRASRQQRRQRIAHLVAEMTIGAREQRQAHGLASA